MTCALGCIELKIFSKKLSNSENKLSFVLSMKHAKYEIIWKISWGAPKDLNYRPNLVGLHWFSLGCDGK